MADKRLQGQIWIGKEKPNVLKYYADSTEYWALTATTYISSEIILKGQPVAVDSSYTLGKRIKPAIWPDDLDKVLGIALNNTTGSGEEVKIVDYGYVDFNEEELDNLFVAPVDLSTLAITTEYSSTLSGLSGGNGWVTPGQGVGHPIYWFTGRHIKSGDSNYKWIGPEGFKGKVTFATPTGYKNTNTEVSWNDDSFNVSYKYLPRIGNVISYEVSNNKVVGMTMHIHFSNFTPRIQFEYPAVGLKYYSTPNVESSNIIRHGLFPDSASYIPQVKINSWGYSDEDVDTETSGEAFTLYPGYDSYIGATKDKRTEIGMLSDSTFYFKIVGEVNYNY